MRKVTNLFLLICTSLTVLGQSIDSLNQIAKSDYQHYQFQKVIDALANRDDLNATSFQLIGKAYVKTGQLAEAEKAYRNALSMDGENVVVKNELAGVYLKLEEDEKAVAIFQELIAADSANAYYHKKIADVYKSLGDPVQALVHYSHANALNAKDIESTLDISTLLMDMQQLNAADSLIQLQLNNYPGQSTLLKAQLKVKYKMKDYASVVEVASELKQKKSMDLLSKKLLGIAYYRTKEADSSIVYLTEVIERTENTEILMFYRGLARLSKEDLAAAKEDFEKAIAAGISENMENYYIQLGGTYERMGNYEQSIQAYRLAYESSKDKTLIYHLARNYDQYYEDKEIALKHYIKYVSTQDTANRLYYDYSKRRIEELKTEVHFNRANSN